MEKPLPCAGRFLRRLFPAKNHKSPNPGSGVPLRLGDAFVQDAGLLLVLVDLDITGRVLILNEQQRGGQGHRQSSEDGEQCFENLHRFKPPW